MQRAKCGLEKAVFEIISCHRAYKTPTKPINNRSPALAKSANFF